MNSYVSPIIWILVIILLLPFFHGLMGISIAAVAALIVFRSKKPLGYVMGLFVIALFNDVIFQTYLGSTFLAIAGLVTIDFLFKKIFPNETNILDLLITTVSFVVYIGFYNALGSLYAGNGFIFFLNWDVFISSVVSSLLMSAITTLFVYVISYISGGTSSHKIIRF